VHGPSTKLLAPLIMYALHLFLIKHKALWFCQCQIFSVFIFNLSDYVKSEGLRFFMDRQNM